MPRSDAQAEDVLSALCRRARPRAAIQDWSRADVLSLDQARKKARVILAQALLGADPQARRRELREIPDILAQLVRDRYLPHVKAYKRSWRTDETVFCIHILPLLGTKPIDEISGDAIADLIQQMRDKGYASGTTNRVLILHPLHLQPGAQVEDRRRSRKSHRGAQYRSGRAARPLSQR